MVGSVVASEFVRVTEWNESTLEARGGVRVGPIESGVLSGARREGGQPRWKGRADGLTHVRSNLRYAYARCVHAELRGSSRRIRVAMGLILLSFDRFSPTKQATDTRAISARNR